MFRNNDISDGGRLVRVEAPDDDVLALADLKKALGVSSVDVNRDNIFKAALAAVAADLDPWFDGWLGRALRPQTWELQLTSFNDRRPSVRPHYNPSAIPLPIPPLLSIVSVKYLDATTGTDTPMTLGTDYRVLGMGAPGLQSIAPLYSKVWPVARIDDASLRIQFTAGYDDDQNVMPPQLTQAIVIGVQALLPLLSRDPMLAEDRVDGLGWKKYQDNPQFAAVIKTAMTSLLTNLKV